MPDQKTDTPNNTGIRPTFQIRWHKSDTEKYDNSRIYFLVIVKYDKKDNMKYRTKFCEFCEKAINTIVHPWAKTIDNYTNIEDWDMDSLIEGDSYVLPGYKYEGDYYDCINIYDTVPNGNNMMEFEAHIYDIEKKDPKIRTFKGECEDKLINLYLEYFPNSK